MIFDTTYEKVLNGTQTQTRRPMKTRVTKAGSFLSVQTHVKQKALGYIKVISVKEQLLGTVTAAEAQAEGYDSLEAFQEAWRQRYGTFDPAEDVWRIEFKLISEDELAPYQARQIAARREFSRTRAEVRRTLRESKS